MKTVANVWWGYGDHYLGRGEWVRLEVVIPPPGPSACLFLFF